MSLSTNSIVTNMLATNSARQLGIVTDRKAKSTEKLSSGYKINRAADDAAGLAISEKMRRQIRGLDMSVQNISDGVSFCNIADGALNEISDMLNREEELLVKAANDTNTDEDKQMIEKELMQLADEMNHVFEVSEFNERKIFKGHDTVLEDPAPRHEFTTTGGSVDDPTITKMAEEYVYLVDPPSNTQVVTEDTTYPDIRTSTYFEGETVHDVDEHQHPSYDVHKARTKTIETQNDIKTTVTTTYTLQPPDPRASNLVKPGEMTGAKGYINVQNELGWALSCAKSQLGVTVDGNVKSLDLYRSGFPVSSNISADGNTAAHTYDLGDGLSLTQTIKLEGNQYKISYAVDNSGTEDHTVSVRLAFDTMNTYDNTDNISNLTTGSYTLTSGFAKIGISSNGDKAVLGSIDDLYGTWGSDRVHENQVLGHTGVGTWWNDKVASAGGTTNIGTLNYGPIELADQYLKTTQTDVDVKRHYYSETEDDVYTIMPEYVDIQAGSEADVVIPIRLWDLDTTKLRCRVPQEVSALNADDSFKYLKFAASKISEIRSYYGASTNRLEHAASNNRNVVENTAAAESMIRDTDMAKEMVENAKDNILQQAGQTMLAQANQNRQGLLQLLG